MKPLSMTDYIIVFLVLVISAFVYYKIADRFNIVDKPNHRSSHDTITIRGGGILFFFAVLCFYVLSNFSYTYFVLGVSLISIVSFADDLVSLSPKIRLFFQVAAVLLICYQIGWDTFPLWAYLPILIVAMGFINIFNFMDGINGITGLCALVVLLSFYYLNTHYQVVNSDLLIYSIMAVIVFAFFNFRKKALMFAGDIGSISMAVILLFVSVLLILKTKSILVIGLYGVYAADAVYTIFYRIYLKEKLAKAHRHHIYQKLVDNLGQSHMRVSISYAVLQAFISAFIVYTLLHVDVKYHLWIGIGIALVLLTLYIQVFKWNEKR